MTEFDLQSAQELIAKAGVRRVRTPAGAKRYGVPIGTPIGTAKAIQSVRRLARRTNRSASRRSWQESDAGSALRLGSGIQPRARRGGQPAPPVRLDGSRKQPRGVPITPEALDRIKELSRNKQKKAPGNAVDLKAIANARRRRRDRERRAAKKS